MTHANVRSIALVASLAFAALMAPAAGHAQDGYVRTEGLQPQVQGGFVTHIGAKPQGSGFIRPSNPWRSTARTSGGYIRSVSDDGAIIQLDDSSVWLVEDVDRVDSELWLATDDVIVVSDDYGRCVYSTAYIIVNIDDAVSVCASRIR